MADLREAVMVYVHWVLQCVFCVFSRAHRLSYLLEWSSAFQLWLVREPHNLDLFSGTVYNVEGEDDGFFSFPLILTTFLFYLMSFIAMDAFMGLPLAKVGPWTEWLWLYCVALFISFPQLQIKVPCTSHFFRTVVVSRPSLIGQRLIDQCSNVYEVMPILRIMVF